MKVTFYILLMVVPVWAQAQGTDLTTPAYWSDFLTPILTSVASIAAAVLTAILMKVLKGVGINLDLQTQNVIDGALERSIGFGVQKASEIVTGGKAIDIENKVIENAILYFHEKWPETVRKLDLDDEKIRDMILSRFGSTRLLQVNEE